MFLVVLVPRFIMKLRFPSNWIKAMFEKCINSGSACLMKGSIIISASQSIGVLENHSITLCICQLFHLSVWIVKFSGQSLLLSINPTIYQSITQFICQWLYLFIYLPIAPFISQSFDVSVNHSIQPFNQQILEFLNDLANQSIKWAITRIISPPINHLKAVLNNKSIGLQTDKCMNQNVKLQTTDISSSSIFRSLLAAFYITTHLSPCLTLPINLILLPRYVHSISFLLIYTW